MWALLFRLQRNSKNLSYPLGSSVTTTRYSPLAIVTELRRRYLPCLALGVFGAAGPKPSIPCLLAYIAIAAATVWLLNKSARLLYLLAIAIMAGAKKFAEW